MRRVIEISWLPGAGVIAILVLLAAVLVLVAVPTNRPYASGGAVQVSFTIAPAVSAESQGDTVVIRTNVPWVATVTGVDSSGVETQRLFRGNRTGSGGRIVRARGRLVSFSVVPQR